MLRVDIITLFPAMFSGYLGESIIQRARQKKLVRIEVADLRDYTRDRHRVVDDRPYGGGAGMVLKPEPLFAAVEDLRDGGARVILLSPRGKQYDQKLARRLSREDHLIFICGHYEGVDERVCRELVDEEISIGDYILTNGALPALVAVDSLVRLIPGVLGDPESSRDESFSGGRLEYPHYTRPRLFRGMEVPEILLSGDHGEVERWRRRRALEVTWRQRPDLLRSASLSEEEKNWLEEFQHPADQVTAPEKGKKDEFNR